ncbi:stage III sporulation protein AF [Paenibacillus sp. UNC496MF]|uniref:stage III sporulation protein AF n=1 Tax=Paenibacillus sp. UNC496MF TaxID=1502753 RepID=UPI0008EC335D|nr:stage III sporulation protein AF [Paenibacillus sp. UNC496MF]SFI57989.1 stage III sporulation protein AF [Paenibacillus sp. UNC496MF]
MLTWLAVWLQQIIAVVLLAGFIDLLLPNKGMQRYVRLVAGLIVLLTILTPIIRVLQGDFSAKLDAQVQEWVQAGSAKELRMPTLQDIQGEAEKLKRSDASSAAALAERQLADAMKAGIEQATGLRVTAVDVRVTAGKDGKPAGIGGVRVTLAPERQSGPADGGTAGEAEGGQAVPPVEDVEAVQVDVAPTAPGNAAADGNEAQLKPAPEASAGAVRTALREGWSVNPAAVDVLEPAPEAAAAR